MNPRYREPSTIIGDARKPLNASHTAVGIQRQRHEIRGEIDGRHGPVSCLTLSGCPLHRVMDDSDMGEFRAYPAIQELMAVKVHIKEIMSHAPLTCHTDTLISPGGFPGPSRAKPEVWEL